MSTNIRARLDFIDAQRGLAVVLMLWLHTADGWLRPALKHGAGWGWIRSIGGHAAPTFLLLAGLSLGLSWRNPGRTTPRVETARGLQLIVLGYALRAQMWMIDAGGYRQLKCWLAVLPLAYGYVALYRALSAYARGETGASLFAYGAAGCGFGLMLVAWLIPARFFPLLRVDVLQAIGASLLCLAALRNVLLAAPASGIVAAAGVALLTPALRARMPGVLPVPIAGYVAGWDVPPGTLIPTLFPLFPWLAYACVGATIGLVIGAAPSSARAIKTALTLSLFGVVLALASCEAFRPAQRLLQAVPDATPLVRVIYRVGVALGLLAVAFALSRPGLPVRKLLLSLGKASLFVYWVHLEFAFGALARPLAHRLGFVAWGFGLATITLLMALLSAAWRRLRSRSSAGTELAKAPQPSPATGSGMSPRSP